MRFLALVTFAATALSLDAVDELRLVNVTADVVTHRGRRAVRLLEVEKTTGESIAIIPGSDFADGVILHEADRHGCAHLVTFEPRLGRHGETAPVMVIGAGGERRR